MSSSTTPKEAVDRLRELLFDQESRQIGALSSRIEELHARAGSEEHFQRSVAKVIDRALRDAESSRHKELSEAMAPMVLRTLRTEMKSPDMQDQIAGVMYPRMGEMVRRYVASAVRDMMQDINRRLESGLSQNRLALWFRSRATGRPMAELALAQTQRLTVDEIYLIRRGSGELIHHWEAGPGAVDEPRAAGGSKAGQTGNRDTLISGFLTAITAFAEEAFEADSASLRTLDLDDHRIYMRGSPAHLLAIKCRGSAPAAVEQLFDAELIRVLEEHQKIEQDTRDLGGPEGRAVRTSAHQRLLDDLAIRLQEGAQSETRNLSQGHSFRTLRRIFLMIAIPLLAFGAWQVYVSWLTSDLQRKSDAVIAGIPVLAGYPLRAHVERGARRMWLIGLLPDDETRREVLSRLKQIAPQVALVPDVSVLPRADVDAKLRTEIFRRAVDSAAGRLDVLGGDLATAREQLAAPEDREALTAAEDAARKAKDTLVRGNPAGFETDERIQELARSMGALQEAATRLAGLAGVEAQRGPAEPRSTVEAADGLVLLAGRISSLVTTLEQRRNISPLAERLDAVGSRTAEMERQAIERVNVLNRHLEERLRELERRLDAMRPEGPTPRQRLQAFIRENAIFFADDVGYREPATARKTLDALAPLISAAGALVRVVGYTDDVGGASRNSPLAQARADNVVAELVARGVPADRLVAVGRLSGIPLAPGTGPESGNRRVEFEIGFRDERRSRP